MPRPRVLRKRIASVRNIHKITKTMERVAQSKSVKIQGKTGRLSSFAAGLERLLENVRKAAAAEIGAHPWCAPRASEKRVALLVITSNRGLCGGYNTKILQAARERMRSLSAEGKTVLLHVIGKKGIAYFRFVNQAVDKAVTDVDEGVDFPHIEPIIGDLAAQFADGRLDAVDIVSMRYRSRARQETAFTRILPFSLTGTAADAASGTAPAEAASPLIEPDPAGMLGGLIPLMLKARFFSLLLEAFLSEQMQRTLAMTNATDNADSMIKRLTREYNRSRQAQITGEMIEIIGGSEGTKR